MDIDQTVFIDYTNYRGERNWRQIRPLRLIFGATDWHPRKQWLLEATDIERGVERTFAVNDIHAWRDHAGGKENS